MTSLSLSSSFKVVASILCLFLIAIPAYATAIADESSIENHASRKATTNLKAEYDNTIAAVGSQNIEVATVQEASQPSLTKQKRLAKVPCLTVFVMTTIMAAASGLGATPFFFFTVLTAEWAALANAIACGVMLTASFELINETSSSSPSLGVLGVVIGTIFIKLVQDFLSRYEDVKLEAVSGVNTRKMLLFVAVMAAHAFGEGSGVGVSFSGQRGMMRGTLVTFAIGLHNVPEGLAVATVLVGRGISPRKAVYWCLLCSLPQAIVAVPSYVFVETFSALLPLALGFAAGCMIWIVFAELMPDALDGCEHSKVATAATLSAAGLQGLNNLVYYIEQQQQEEAADHGLSVSSMMPWPADATSHMGSFFLLLLLIMLGTGATAGAVSRGWSTLSFKVGLAAGVLGSMGLGRLAGAACGGTVSPLMALALGLGGGLLTVALDRLTPLLRSKGLISMGLEHGKLKDEDVESKIGSSDWNGHTPVDTFGHWVANGTVPSLNYRAGREAGSAESLSRSSFKGTRYQAGGQPREVLRTWLLSPAISTLYPLLAHCVHVGLVLGRLYLDHPSMIWANSLSHDLFIIPVLAVSVLLGLVLGGLGEVVNQHRTGVGSVWMALASGGLLSCTAIIGTLLGNSADYGLVSTLISACLGGSLLVVSGRLGAVVLEGSYQPRHALLGLLIGLLLGAVSWLAVAQFTVSSPLSSLLGHCYKAQA